MPDRSTKAGTGVAGGAAGRPGGWGRVADRGAGGGGAVRTANAWPKTMPPAQFEQLQRFGAVAGHLHAPGRRLPDARLAFRQGQMSRRDQRQGACCLPEQVGGLPRGGIREQGGDSVGRGAAARARTVRKCRTARSRSGGPRRPWVWRSARAVPAWTSGRARCASYSGLRAAARSAACTARSSVRSSGATAKLRSRAVAQWNTRMSLDGSPSGVASTTHSHRSAARRAASGSSVARACPSAVSV